MSKKSDKKKAKMLRHIDLTVKAKGWPPTVREIQDRFNFSSTSVVSYWLDVLESEELIRREKGSARAIALTPNGRMFMEAIR